MTGWIFEPPTFGAQSLQIEPWSYPLSYHSPLKNELMKKLQKNIALKKLSSNNNKFNHNKNNICINSYLYYNKNNNKVNHNINDIWLDKINNWFNNFNNIWSDIVKYNVTHFFNPN